VVGGADIGVEEEVSRVGVWPVGRDGVFVFGVRLNIFNNSFERAILAY
jgi:hypothetical protein